MSRPQSQDARAVLRLAEQAVAQLRRIADHFATPIGPDDAQRAQEREYAADIMRALVAKGRHEAEPSSSADERAIVLDLADGPVLCPLCPSPLTHHTLPGACAHLRAVHPARRLTGKGAGPQRVLILDAEPSALAADDEEVRTARRAEEYEQERDQLMAVLAEVLRHFTEHGHPGAPCIRTGWVRTDTVDRWRSVVQHDVERPWWVQVDEARAELREAQTAIERVRNLHIRNPNSGTCEHCSARDYPEYAVRSPCHTITALDKTGEPATGCQPGPYDDCTTCHPSPEPDAVTPVNPVTTGTEPDRTAR
ncbi:hypothetical protein ACFWN1_14665 [Streptomyces sp. NPDC058459]|uniref:hypothetical protein n=1 Tax=Streptomyces sp. NPDC058459 TaxID=3346508 RepID=UPI00365BF56B